MKYDIFLSYRREGGFETAKHLYDLLIRDGYRVSFDIDTLQSGDFDRQLYSRIDECKDFIIVLDANAFKRTLDPTFPENNDWMRNELAYALQRNKNIVPVMLSGFTFPRNLPSDISDITKKNAPVYTKEYFENFYKKLKTFLVSKPRKKVILYGSLAVIAISIAALTYYILPHFNSDSTVEQPSVIANEELKVVQEKAIEIESPKPVVQKVTEPPAPTTPKMGENKGTELQVKAKESPSTKENNSAFDKDEFAKLFEQELAKLDEKTKPIVTKGDLPDWVFEGQGDGKYVGISNPDVDSEKGFNQALVRAWMLSQLNNDALIKSTIESYSSYDINNDDYRFEHIINMEVSPTKNVTFTPVRQHISNYGEYFIEFKTTDPSTDNSYSFNIDKDAKIFFTQYLNSVTSQGKEEVLESLSGEIYYTEYQIDKTSYSSEDVTKRKCNYKNTTNALGEADIDGNRKILLVCSSKGRALMANSTANGYWHSLICSILHSAADAVESHEMQVSSVTNINVDTDAKEALLRNIASEKFKANLINVEISDNHLYGDWNIQIK